MKSACDVIVWWLIWQQGLSVAVTVHPEKSTHCRWPSNKAGCIVSTGHQPFPKTINGLLFVWQQSTHRFQFNLWMCYAFHHIVFTMLKTKKHDWLVSGHRENMVTWISWPHFHAPLHITPTPHPYFSATLLILLLEILFNLQIEV